MSYQLDDLVEVYDPDERQWLAGHVQAIQTIANMPEQFYVVKLDDKPPLTEQSFTTFLSPKGQRALERKIRLGVIAVPASHKDWIRPRTDVE